VNTFSFRTIIATALVSAVALSGCGGSDSSDVRTRNSSINDPCIGVYPTSGNSVVTAAITSSDCATSLVDVSPRHYKPAINGNNTNPYADRRDPSATQMDYNHEFKQFVIAHEARDANNAPIEYVQTTGDGKDIATNVYKRSKIVPLSASDQGTACVQPLAGSDRKTPAIGFSENKSNDCKKVDSYQVTLYVGEAGNQRILYELATWGSYAFEIADNNFPVGLGYYAVVGMVDGYPHTKMVITRPSADSVNVAHYRYLEPTRMFQFSEGDTSSTSSSSSTIATPDTTISTLPVENSTPVEESSTSTPSSTDVTSTSTDVDNTSTNIDGNTDTNRRDIVEACAKLDGVQTTPATDKWNEGEQFTIQVSNDCMNPAKLTGFNHYGISHKLTAVNEASGQIRNIRPFIFQDTKYFIGRLLPGEWQLRLEQRVYLQTSAGEDMDLDSFMTINVTVKTNSENPLVPCTISDVKWDGKNMALACKFTEAKISYLTTTNAYLSQGLPENQMEIELLNLIPGWNVAQLRYNASGYEDSLDLLICSSDCSQFPNEVQASLSRTSDKEISIKSKRATCIGEQDPYMGVLQYKKINPHLMVYSLGDGAMRESDFDVSSDGENASVTQGESTDHLLVYQSSKTGQFDCASKMPGLLIAIYPLADLPAASKQEPTVNQDVVKPPTRIDVLELSRTDATGTPVVIDPQQTMIQIPVSALPALFADDGTAIAKASVLNADNEWVRLSSVLPTNVKIAAGITELKVKYTFSDGTESIVTKKVESPSVYESQIAATTKSSSSLLVILTVLALLLLVSAIVVIRKRK
jgi:uncharacterized membrane protein